jgi:hypothetical protein
VLVAGCGSSSSSSSQSGSSPAAAPTTSTAASTTTAAASTTANSPGALSAEARSAATGDIPDNQVFLTYKSSAEHYSMLYPEGWALKGSGNDLTINNNNNIVHVVVRTGATPTTATVTAELNALKQSNPTLAFTPPTVIQLTSGPAIKARYTTRSAPNAVTGKSVLLLVDRYELSKAGKRATIDLGTPQGVDNVDAYRKMINSFRWQ